MFRLFLLRACAPALAMLLRAVALVLPLPSLAAYAVAAAVGRALLHMSVAAVRLGGKGFVVIAFITYNLMPA